MKKRLINLGPSPATVILIILSFLQSTMLFSDRKSIVHPGFENIQILIIEEGCFIKRELRKKMAEALKELDKIHCRFMVQSGYTISSPSNFLDQVMKKTAILPLKIPLCERTIIYSLILQIDILDTIFLSINRSDAEMMREKRKKKRILDNNKKIFNDYRDVYFFMILDLLGDISELHHGLGVQIETGFDFPTGIDRTEAEFFLLKKIKSVSLNAEKLMPKND